MSNRECEHDGCGRRCLEGTDVSPEGTRYWRGKRIEREW